MPWIACSSSASVRSARGAVGAALVMLAACSSPADGPQVNRLSISPGWPGARVGGTVQLRAIGWMRDLTQRDLTSVATWRSSDAGVATVSATGLVTGTSPGTTSIQAGVGDIVFSVPFVVSTIHPVDRTLLAAPDAAYVRDPSVAIDDAGTALVAFGLESPDLRRLTVMRSEPEIPPTAWQTWTFDDPKYQEEQVLVRADSGQAGIAYELAGTFSSLHPFGLQYFDGTSWLHLATIHGSFPPQLAMMEDGTLFVGYVPDGSTSTIFEVDRYDALGLRDWIYLPRGGSFHRSPSGGLMLFSALGSRTFDGVSWSEEAPWQGTVYPGYPYVQYRDSGEADAVAQHGLLLHFHYDGVAWDTGTDLGTISEDAAAAGDDDGRLVLAYLSGEQSSQVRTEARVFDGTTWGPAVVIGPATSSKSGVRAFADGAGRFLVLWKEPGALAGRSQIAGTFYDGSWHPAQRIADAGGAYFDADMNRSGLMVIVNDCEGYDTLSASFVAFEP